jgi:hypothetical protein
VDELPFGGGPGETCIEDDLAATETQVNSVRPAGKSYYYLVRADNTCGPGPYGQDSGGTERTSSTCP